MVFKPEYRLYPASSAAVHADGYNNWMGTGKQETFRRFAHIHSGDHCRDGRNAVGLFPLYGWNNSLFLDCSCFTDRYIQHLRQLLIIQFQESDPRADYRCCALVLLYHRLVYRRRFLYSRYPVVYSSSPQSCSASAV